MPNTRKLDKINIFNQKYLLILYLVYLIFFCIKYIFIYPKITFMILKVGEEMM